VLLALADMHDIVNLRTLCPDKLAASLSASSVVQGLRVLQLHRSNSNDVMTAYKSALSTVRLDNNLLREFSRHFLNEQSPAVMSLAAECILQDDHILDKVMGSVLERLSDASGEASSRTEFEADMP